MALYDNKHWLLSHIRNSFISSDDTGMCEAVIIDDIPKQSTLFGENDKFPEADDSEEDEDNELSNSFDIQTEFDFPGHRHRTNTAQRLERMEQEKRKAAKMKHVQWENNPVPITDEEREQLFERKVIVKDKKPVRSVLSDEIENCPLLPKNPFTEFAKFDGNAQVGVPTRTYGIFLTMLPPQQRNYPFQVCILGSAKVSELIGFVCWKYMAQNTDPNFAFKDLESYGLFIAEDDGEVDWDFSTLDPRETVGKFGLAYLALVELSEPNVPPEAESKEIYVRPAEDQSVLERRDSEDLKRIKVDLTRIEALLYQAFHVHILTKMRAKTEVILGISGDKVEIDPVAQGQTKVSGKLWRQKAVAHDMESVVSCDLVETKSSNRAVFRLVYHSSTTGSTFDQSGSLPQSGTSSFKNHDFEADQQITEEVVKKVNHILQLKSGALRRDYLALKQKKTGRRRSFSIWPR